MHVAGTTLARRFELVRRLGAGAMGEVFEALDRDSGEAVALKTLTRADGDTLLRFKREFRALQSTAHPNLVALRELVSDGEQWFFTMELVRGRHFLEAVGRDPQRLRALLRQLVHGLRSLHDAGLVHRDVKPSNVMVTDDDRVVLLDFGLVTPTDFAKQSTEGRAIGTIDYMAPEQAVGNKVTPAADWYAVGVMAFEALTGQVPHVGHALQILVAKQQVEAPLVSALAPDAPVELVTLCRDLLRIEPAHRPDGAALGRRLGGAPRATIPIARGSTVSGRAVFVGRDHELRSIAASLATSRAHPLVHLVVGQSGIGKSELVSHACAQATLHDSRTLVLRGRCYERESLPYKALDGVVDGVIEHLLTLPPALVAALLPARAALLVRAFPAFRRIDLVASARLGAAEAGEPHEQRRRVFETLRALLSTLAADRPVVIAIDDLQWADTDSFALLREVLRGNDAPRLLVIATLRDAASEEALTPRQVAERLAPVSIVRTDLGPLTDDESRTLAEAIGPGVIARVDLGRLTREAAGHPMFLCELVRHADTGAATVSLDDALWARVALLEPEARELLAAICVAGAPVAFDVATAVSGLDPTTLGRAAAALRVASPAREAQRGRGLALEPYHDRVREAVVGRLDPARTVELHARLGLAIEQRDGARDPHVLFRHFHQAGLAVRAADYAEQAAAVSHAAHAFDQAASLWRWALELVPRDPDERRRLLLRLGEALVAAGRGVAAAEVYRQAAHGADHVTRLSCQRHIAEQLLVSGRIEPGVAALQELLAEIGVPAPDTPRGIMWSLARARLRLRVRGLGWRSRQRHEISDADVLRLDVLSVAATGLSVVDTMRGADFQTRSLLMALSCGHRPHIARAAALEATYLATLGKHARSASMIARAQTIIAEAPDAYLTSLLNGTTGIIRYMQGDNSEARRLLDAGEGGMRNVPGASWELASIKLFHTFVLRNVADFRALRDRYDRYVSEADDRGDQYVGSTIRRAAAQLWLAEDEPERADHELAKATWVPPGATYHVQHYHALISRLDMALYRGDVEALRELMTEARAFRRALLMRVVPVAAGFWYGWGRAALALGDVGGAAVAVRRLSRVDSRIARAWAPLVAGGIAAARGDRDAATAAFDTAIDAAVDAGMRTHEQLARLRAAGDDGARAAAVTKLHGLGVVAPERMADAFAPVAPVR